MDEDKINSISSNTIEVGEVELLTPTCEIGEPNTPRNLHLVEENECHVDWTLTEPASKQYELYFNGVLSAMPFY